MGLEAKKLIENNDLKKYGELMNYHWKKKIERSKNITNKKINYIYEEALKNGCLILFISFVFSNFEYFKK